MNVLTVLLQAPAGAAGGGSMMWIMLIAMFKYVYLIFLRSSIGIVYHLLRLITSSRSVSENRVKDLPNNVVLTSEPPSELRVRVKDKGTVLLNYMLGKSFYPKYSPDLFFGYKQ